MRRTSTGRPWSTALVGWLAVVSSFQACLAAGVPWGAAAWGGGHPGVLPTRLRWSSAGSAVVLGALATVAAGPPRGRSRSRVLRGVAAYAGVGVVANGLSRSAPERLVWTPMCALGSVLALRASREGER